MLGNCQNDIKAYITGGKIIEMIKTTHKMFLHNMIGRQLF